MASAAGHKPMPMGTGVVSLENRRFTAFGMAVQMKKTARGKHPLGC